MQVSMIGLDLAKNSFQVHGVDAAGGVVLRKRLSRGQVERFCATLAPAVVGMEPAAARISGRGCCKSSATRCG